MFRVAVIGGGWYGCHLASSFSSIGFNVTLFERHSRLLHEASGNNQFRLHMGFHYARHHGTRKQSRDGFSRFLERYPTLSLPVECNIYAVPRWDSLIDFATYKLIMASSGIDFVELVPHNSYLADVDGAISTNERVLLINRARSFFKQRLGQSVILNCGVSSVEISERFIEVEGQRFDYVIDATWGHYTPVPLEMYFEPTILLYYQAKENFPAVTLVDGPLCSIYPTEEPTIFTLSSVLHTPLGRCSSSAEAHDAIASVDSAVVKDKRSAMEMQVCRNVPAFREVFRFMGIQLSIKTKPQGMADDRSCYVFQNGRLFNVMSGKIDTIFFATERILSLIETDNSLTKIEEEPSLRHDIVLTES